MKNLEFFIVCRNPDCQAVKAVRDRSTQRRQKYCSRRCVGVMCAPVVRLTLEERRRAAKKSKRVRRAQAMRRLQRLSKLQAFRMGFSTGWKAGARSARRRMQIVPGDRS